MTSKATTSSTMQKQQQQASASASQKAMTKEEITKWHGYACIEKPWAQTPPTCIYKNDELARKDYTEITRSEYRDSDEVLSSKADILIDMFKKSQHAAVFVGAGIEVSCGTPDYASHERSAPQVKAPPRKSCLHRLLTAFLPECSTGALTSASSSHRVAASCQQNHSRMFERAGRPLRSSQQHCTE